MQHFSWQGRERGERKKPFLSKTIWISVLTKRWKFGSYQNRDRKNLFRLGDFFLFSPDTGTCHPEISWHWGLDVIARDAKASLDWRLGSSCRTSARATASLFQSKGWMVVGSNPAGSLMPSASWPRVWTYNRIGPWLSTRLVIWRLWVQILPNAGLFSFSFYLFLLSFTRGMSLIRSLKEVHVYQCVVKAIQKMDA